MPNSVLIKLLTVENWLIPMLSLMTSVRTQHSK